MQSKNSKGYTLMEMIIVVSLLVIVLLGGTTIFYRNLRSSGFANVDLTVSSELRTALSSIERDIRFSMVDTVGSGTRTDCLAAGTDGYQGNSLTVTDLQGLTTVYSLDSERIASVSALTSRTVYLTTTSTKVKTLNFTWYCLSGVSDKIRIDVGISSSVSSSGLNIDRTVSREINLLNSGIN